ncbi:fimbrial protein [Serratia sp. J2]|uniref:fimbrial protein n=1 Tax=Serratia sp. J2 TaxID=3386551 RepID=UPI0039171933
MKNIIILMLTILFSFSAKADFTCAYDNNAVVFTVPLSGTVSVGVDSPNGTVLYNGMVTQSTTPTYRCDAGPQWLDQQFLNILSAPSPLSTWSGSPFPGAVYTTNIPGVGIAIWSQLVPASAATTTSKVLVWSGTRQNLTNIPVRLTLGYSLIKIGNISPGAITGMSLPTFGISLQVTPNVVGFPWQAITYNFSGALNIVANTCETPDVNVNLGAWDIAKLGAIGKTTQWVKSNITLKNCPTFSGYYSTNTVNNYTDGTVNIPGRDANALSVSLTPATQLIDATNGVMAINAGTTAASGIGIQLGWGDYTAAPTLFNFNQDYNYTPPTSGVT